MGTVDIIGTGEAILTRSIRSSKRDGFDDMVSLLRSACATITNVEFTFPAGPRTPSTTYGGSHLGADPSLLDEFAWMGVDLYGLANNHSTDYGVSGLTSSLEQLETRGLTWAGAGRTLREARRPAYLDTQGGRVAFLAATSSNARLSMAADPGTGDVGRPGVNPLRLQTTHFIRHDQFGELQRILSDAGVDVKATGNGAPGVWVTYPDRNIYERPPADGFAVESVVFAPDETSHIFTTAIQRDVDALLAGVDEAKRQADVVVVGLHCHEGSDGRWNTDTPATFMQPLAHALIDAGAHAVIATGPHMLRGMELYNGLPICYSLGDFIYTLETTPSFPLEIYEAQDMPLESSPADFYDRMAGFVRESRFWESVLARFVYDDGRLVDTELIPISLGRQLPRARRGVPAVVNGAEGRAILERLDELSLPFNAGVEIVHQNGRTVGKLVSKSGSS